MRQPITTVPVVSKIIRIFSVEIRTDNKELHSNAMKQFDNEKKKEKKNMSDKRINCDNANEKRTVEKRWAPSFPHENYRINRTQILPGQLFNAKRRLFRYAFKRLARFAINVQVFVKNVFQKIR